MLPNMKVWCLFLAVVACQQDSVSYQQLIHALVHLSGWCMNGMSASLSPEESAKMLSLCVEPQHVGLKIPWMSGCTWRCFNAMDGC